MRLTRPAAALTARPPAGRSAVGAVLLAITVAACSGGGGSGSAVPSVFTPSAPASGTPAPSATRATPASAASSSAASRTSAGTSTSARTSAASASASAAAAAPPAASASTSASAASSAPASRAPHTVTPRPASTTVVTRYPTIAPQTGGGGTAGLQDSLLFGIGGTAVLAGMASLAYRRRLTRK